MVIVASLMSMAGAVVSAQSPLTASATTAEHRIATQSSETLDSHPHGGQLRQQAAERIPLSQDVRDVLDWVRRGNNNAQRPFALLDKRRAAIHVFDAAGVLQASSAALLGLAHGDDSVPGIGERPMSQIAPHERTTPAGRFVSEPGRNLQGHDIVWIDYDDAVSLHRVRSSKPAERRLQRLASRTADDNRISYGCVNVPASFYDHVIAPTLGQQAGVIYVLPETQSVAEFFGLRPPQDR